MNRSDISTLITKLGDKDIHARDQARLLLVNAGSEVTQSLIDLLHSAIAVDRLEAAKLLGHIRDKSAAEALVEALTDESMNVHWAASEALIELGGGAIVPLLEGITKHFESARFRQGAYHILHMFERLGMLESHVQEVLISLRNIGPATGAPWAAERAIEALKTN